VIALADKITKSFGGRVLYAAATLQLNAGERWGLVGPNGAGKTTLLKIIMGQESPDEGTVSFAKDTTVGYLEQETKISGEKTALQEVVDSAHEIKALGARVKARARGKDLDHKPEGPELDRLLEDYGTCAGPLRAPGRLRARCPRPPDPGLAWAFLSRTSTSLPEDFSGGWQMRIALSKLLLRHPDLLLLDEPTNHLDLESVQWLEHFLSLVRRSSAARLARPLLHGCLREPRGGAIENRASPPTRATTPTPTCASARTTSSRCVQARGPGARDRPHAGLCRQVPLQADEGSQAQERMKRIEKIKSELVILPEDQKKVHFSFPDPPRTGDTVVKRMRTCRESHFGDEPRLRPRDLKLYRGDHVALVGPNGAGKSTLMKLINGHELTPDERARSSWART
jgi:ATP-binding cassette subfamily F protein 3